MAIVCAGCGDPIAERTLLSALDRFWHNACLNCSCCGLRLDDLGPSVFVRSDMILCRQDYLRLFGLSGTCARCRQKIPPDELVMRCQENVYHVRCFSCAHCHVQLNPGDKVCLVDGNLFCESEFPQLFSVPSSKWSSSAKSPNQSIPNLFISSNQTDLFRSIVYQDDRLKSPTVLRSPSYQNSLELHNIGSLPYSPVAINTSDMSGSLNSHPESPVVTMLNPNHVLSDNPLTPNSSFGVPDLDSAISSDSKTISQAFITDKQTSKNIPANGIPPNEPTAPGRKKQKKVDSRRCAPLRVC